MQTKIRDILNEAAAQAQEAFPAELARLLVFTTDSTTPVYVSADIADALTANVQAVKQLIEKEHAYIRKVQCLGLAYHPTRVAAVPSVRMISLLDEMPGIYTDRYTHDMRLLYVFDHELGHQVVLAAMGGHIGECRADAFAALRHIQRYGLDTDFFKMSNKALTIVLGTSPKHYTEDIFAAVRAYAQTHDITKLSLPQTAELAHAIVEQAKPDARSLMTALTLLAQRFGPAAAKVAQVYKDSNAVMMALYGRDARAYDLFCREAALVMIAHRDDADVQRAGQRFLNYPPLRAFIDTKAAQDPAWQIIRRLAEQPLPAEKKMLVLGRSFA